MQCYTTTIRQMKPCTLDVHLLNSWGYFTSRVSKDERAHVCVWCARMTLRVMTVCVSAGDIKGWRSASLPLPSAGFPPVPGVWVPGTSGGLWLGSRLYGCLNKSLTRSLGQVAGDETTRLPPLRPRSHAHAQVSAAISCAVADTAHTFTSDAIRPQGWGIS